MRIAIHHTPNTFSDTWIAYCEKKSIPYKLVNCYDSNIIEQVSDCDALMWHHNHASYKDLLFAKQLLYSIEQAGKHVFPNFNTTWHFDDKVGQKYLFEAIGAPLVPSYVFYDKVSAEKWANSTSYPKVFKLRGGAGAANVKLVKSKAEALNKIRQAFGRGFSPFDRLGLLKERWRRFKMKEDTFLGVMKGIGRLFIPTEFAKMSNREKGYVYFQDFIPNNEFDTRVVVIHGEKALAERRFVRKNDFRASGSGKFDYNDIHPEIIKQAFKIAQQLELQSIAFDFVMKNEEPLVIEMSYGYGTQGISNAPGYWDTNLNWHEGKYDSQKWVIEKIIQDIKKKNEK